MTTDEAKRKLIDLAREQVGYTEGTGKRTKYAEDLDATGVFYNGKKNGFDWCDVFVDWCFYKAFGLEESMKMLYQPYKSLGAGCMYSADYYDKAGAWTDYPEAGDQIFFGQPGDEDHTGIVYGVTANYVFTVEGNTSGGKVALKQYHRDDSWISGYGRPKWSVVADGVPADANEEKLDKIAREVIRGAWGNGTDRVIALRAAGWDPEAVQNRVNAILSGALKNEEDLTDVAFQVIRGMYGNGAVRVAQLKAAGWDPEKVQQRVNEILKGV